MMSGRLNTNTAAAVATDGFPYAPMHTYAGLDAGMASQRPPVLQHHLYDGLDFAAAAFQLQEPPLLPLPANLNLPLPTPPPMTMAMPLPMPMAGLPDVYPLGLVKRECANDVDVGGGGGRLGLNLGRRTYFSPGDLLAVDRLLLRSRLGFAGLGLGGAHHPPPRCQAEGCKADLSGAKHYHRRHKVCEYHAKAAAVVAGGKPQRFCQQCSRFHVLAEFDEAKRSCRKRLTEHNRRRRKAANTTPAPKDSPPPSHKAKIAASTTKSAVSSNAGVLLGCLSYQSKVKPSMDAVQEKKAFVNAAFQAQGQQERFITSPVQHDDGCGGNGNDDDGNILLCSSSTSSSAVQANGEALSDQHNMSGGGNMQFFEVDFV